MTISTRIYKKQIEQGKLERRIDYLYEPLGDPLGGTRTEKIPNSERYLLNNKPIPYKDGKRLYGE